MLLLHCPSSSCCAPYSLPTAVRQAYLCRLEKSLLLDSRLSRFSFISNRSTHDRHHLQLQKVDAWTSEHGRWNGAGEGRTCKKCFRARGGEEGLSSTLGFFILFALLLLPHSLAIELPAAGVGGLVFCVAPDQVPLFLEDQKKKMCGGKTAHATCHPRRRAVCALASKSFQL